jgi:hypothetical protein
MYEMDQYTVSLLHFDGGLTDESGKVWTANGGAATSNTQSEFGGSSLYLNGSQYISTPMSDDLKFVSNDFTIDFWMYTNKSGASYGTDLFNNTVAGTYTGPALYYVGNTIYGSVSVNGTSWISATNTIIPNTWNHVAFIKNGNNLYIAINGVLGTPTTISGSAVESSQNYAVIGSLLGGSVDFHYTGYIDEFRISKGIARWTSNFDPNIELRALLVITMSDEIQKEYDLSMDEINAFITWYDTRATGTGLPHYIFNKDFNLGPFQSREDYLVFDKIQNFEVMEYTK